STACPELLEELRWPPVVESSDLGVRAPGAGDAARDPFWDHPSLFVQPAGSRCGVHVDGFESQFAQVLLQGRKRWSFWPLEEADQFRFMGRQDKVRLEVRAPDYSQGLLGRNNALRGGSSYRRQLVCEQVFPELNSDAEHAEWAEVQKLR
ncbi:unnamed protein product, partial [Polarella glacialis]